MDKDGFERAGNYILLQMSNEGRWSTQIRAARDTPYSDLLDAIFAGILSVCHTVNMDVPDFLEQAKKQYLESYQGLEPESKSVFDG